LRPRPVQHEQVVRKVSASRCKTARERNFAGSAEARGRGCYSPTGRVLFVLVLLAHHRRRIVHFAITEHPTAAWTAQQIIEAFPDDTAPRWLLRDRDAIYSDAFRRRVAGMDIREVVCAPSCPWQNPYAERLIGSLRRECLDHIIVFSEAHLRRVLTFYVFYYHRTRTHLALEKDAPVRRRVQASTEGRVIAFPEVGGLHHRYERRAA